MYRKQTCIKSSRYGRQTVILAHRRSPVVRVPLRILQEGAQHLGAGLRANRVSKTGISQLTEAETDLEQRMTRDDLQKPF